MADVVVQAGAELLDLVLARADLGGTDAHLQEAAVKLRTREQQA
jgi:hypothetical protein